MSRARSQGNAVALYPPRPASPPNPYKVLKWSSESPLETKEQARIRIEAANKSKMIDLILLEGKKDLERRRKATKLLLLGQSESGKTSVIKNFQRTFAPKHFDNEKPIWKVIIQLNIIGMLKTILEVLKEELEPDSLSPPSSPMMDVPHESIVRDLRKLREALTPLFLLEPELLKIVCPESSDSRDLVVRSGTGWKSRLLSNLNLNAFSFSSPPVSDQTSAPRQLEQPLLNVENDPTPLLAAQREYIVGMWSDSAVQKILSKRRPSLRSTPGFFMDDIPRIANMDYLPSDKDIVKARVRTLGAEEYIFEVEKDLNSEFFITDVGGTKHQRANWAPFFDDVHAILFLAPLAFNEYLAEDRQVNRLEDTVNIWKNICSNKLLQSTFLILFLNKKDVLIDTLAAGVQVKKYVTTYDFPNDVANVTKYFKNKFRSYHKRFSPEPRPFICHETSAIDVKSMTVLLLSVRESILRRYLTGGNMM